MPRSSRFRVEIASLLCWQLRAASGHNGYTLHITAPNSMAGTKAMVLDAAGNSEVARLANGWTTGRWILFEDVSYSFQPSLMLNNHRHGNFYEGLGGLQGGYQFGMQAPQVIKAEVENASKSFLMTSWHHYAESWDRLSGNTVTYIDGVKVHSDTTALRTDSFLTSDKTYLHIGMHCYPDVLLANAYTQCNQEFQLSGRLDDIAVWAGVQSEADIASKYATSLAARKRAGLEPDLIFLYDFEGVAYDSTFGVNIAPNLGSAGSDYDLMLGKMAKPAGGEIFGLSFATGGVTQIAILPPTAVPSSDSTSWSTPKAQDTSAPIVVTAEAGETVTINQNGVSTTYTAPNPFTSTTSFVESGVTIHVVPLIAPVARALSVTGLEDFTKTFRLYSTHSTGLETEVVIVAPPKGALHEVAHCSITSLNGTETSLNAVGAVLDATGLCALYTGLTNSYGVDTFTYLVRYVSRPAIVSNTATVTLNIKAFDDKPGTVAASIAMVEDGTAQLITLNASDSEPGTPLDLYIKTLPSRGKLYLTSDGTLTGTRTLIDRPFNNFDVGDDVQAQYLAGVEKVSSFWGGPPHSGYHPLTIIGPPDCATQGECRGEGAWITDMSIAPAIGQRLVHAKLTAFVVSYHKTYKPDGTVDGTVDISYHKMYKPDADGVFKRCHFDTSCTATTGDTSCASCAPPAYPPPPTHRPPPATCPTPDA